MWNVNDFCSFASARMLEFCIILHYVNKAMSHHANVSSSRFLRNENPDKKKKHHVLSYFSVDRNISRTLSMQWRTSRIWLMNYVLLTSEFCVCCNCRTLFGRWVKVCWFTMSSSIVNVLFSLMNSYHCMKTSGQNKQKLGTKITLFCCAVAQMLKNWIHVYMTYVSI